MEKWTMLIKTENGWVDTFNPKDWKKDKTLLEQQGIGAESIAYQYHWAVQSYVRQEFKTDLSITGNVDESQMLRLISARKATIKKPRKGKRVLA
jgi:hypothetical protein